jgi:hypothetical protein
MPTGYTEIISTKPEVTFEEFALRCARAFGALIMLRDESIDASLPQKIEATDYHLRKGAEAEKWLATVREMSPDECERQAARQFEKADVDWRKSEAERKALGERYRAMIAKVMAWNPPTPDHQGLKQFMLQQLRESLEWDAKSYPELRPKRLSGADWLSEEMAKARRDIAYHAEEYQSEVKRAADRNEWLQKLRQSLVEWERP